MTDALEQIRLYRVDMPLVRPFRTSFGTQLTRDILLVEARTKEGISGWGECVAMDWPGYSYEYVDGCVDVLTEHLIPLVFADEDARSTLQPNSVQRSIAGVRGYPMAKTALTTALLDAWLQSGDERLIDYLGAAYPQELRERVPCGVSVGIPTNESINDLLDEVAGYVAEGYLRIKLKIQPGWDLAPVRAVRETWPQILLQTDANQAYGRADVDLLRAMDKYDLLLVEQPLPEEDLIGHAMVAAQIDTPVCLDESITSIEVVESALALKATSVINIKPGRIGGYIAARDIHDLCRNEGIPVWCGGMLETGIGRAANVALAALPGFTLPGDTSASGRYYGRDVTVPFELDDGHLTVPTGPGIGVRPIPAVLEELTTWSAFLGPV